MCSHFRHCWCEVLSIDEPLSDGPSPLVPSSSLQVPLHPSHQPRIHIRSQFLPDFALLLYSSKSLNASLSSSSSLSFSLLLSASSSR